jgi:hypothetical protein
MTTRTSLGMYVCALLALSLVGCGAAAKPAPQAATPVPKPAITQAEAVVLCDTFLVAGATPFSGLNESKMASATLASIDLRSVMVPAFDSWAAKSEPVIAIVKGGLPKARAAFANKSSSELFDIAWSGFTHQDPESAPTPRVRTGVEGDVAALMLMDILRPLSESERVISVPAVNTISVAPTGKSSDGVTHRYVVEKRGEAWVIIDMPTLGDSEVAQAKQRAAIIRRSRVQPTDAELKKEFGKDKRLWMGQDKTGQWWVALSKPVGGGVMTVHDYAYMASRTVVGEWVKLDLGAPGGAVQVDSISAPVPSEVIAALRKAGVTVNVVKQ